MNIADNMLSLIGNTPLVRLNSMAQDCQAEVVAKLEFYNPLGSIKDRIALSMVKTALETGAITKESTLVEPTSGNTGIGLAFVCAVYGLKLILTMPASMSAERRALLTHFGAELILTPAALGMKGAIQKAERIAEQTPNTVMLQQFSNPANPEIHRQTTAEEIWHDTGGKVDVLVAGVGTGGSITGVGKALRQYNPQLYVVAVEPKASAVLSGKKPAPHPIQGIGAGFVPQVLDTDVYNEIITVSGEDAINAAKALAEKEGILCGISSGANAFAALAIANRPEMQGRRVVFFVCDTGERYLSTALFD